MDLPRATLPTHNCGVDAWVVVVTVCLLVALGGLFAARRRGRRRPAPVANELGDELDALAQALLAERHHEVGAPLSSALEQVRGRGVPLTGLRPQGRIRKQFVLAFADGTEIVARAPGGGAAGSLLTAMLQGRVLVSRWVDDGESFRVELKWHRGRAFWEAVALASPAVSA